MQKKKKRGGVVGGGMGIGLSFVGRMNRNTEGPSS